MGLLSESVVFLLRLSVFAALWVSFSAQAVWYVATQVTRAPISSGQELSYDNPSVTVILPGYHGLGAQYLDTGCINNTPTAPHYTWDYISFPSKVFISPKSYILLVLNDVSGWEDRGDIDNKHRYAKRQTRPQLWGSCGAPGQVTAGDVWARDDISLVATLFDMGDLHPGTYSENISVKTAQVASTNDSTSMNEALNSADEKVPYASTAETIWTLNSTITPKCSMSVSDIILDHGDINLKQVEGNQSTRAGFSFTCLIESDVDMQIVAAKTLTGYKDNETDCSNGIVCEVSFSDGRTVVEYRGVTAINNEIFSVLHKINGGRVSPGEFSGSALLVVTYK